MEKRIITIDKNILSGTPVFYNTRVPIRAMFDYIEGGETLQEFLENFPTVSENLAISVLELAKNLLMKEEKEG
jgi:uncharacterized protein (DUF433 family)